MQKEQVASLKLVSLMFLVLVCLSVSAMALGELELPSTYHYSSWICYDNFSDRQGNETGCNSFEDLHEKAKASCQGRCSSSKCGINSFTIYSQCDEKPSCGNGVCQVGEDSMSCPSDCAQSVTLSSGALWRCQDGFNQSSCSSCQNSKSLLSLAEASCKGKCNDKGVCGIDFFTAVNKNCSVECNPACGNGICEEGEQFNNQCKADCKVTTCNDTDGGLVYNFKGLVSFGGKIKEDSCNNEGLAVNECLGDKCMLTEYYCSTDFSIGQKDVKCTFGCNDGACVTDHQPVCGDGVCETGESTSCKKDCESPEIPVDNPNNQTKSNDGTTFLARTPPANSVVLQAKVDDKPISFAGIYTLLTPGGLKTSGCLSGTCIGSGNIFPIILPDMAPGLYASGAPGLYASLACISSMPCFDHIEDANGNRCTLDPAVASGVNQQLSSAVCSQVLKPGGSLVFTYVWKTKSLEIPGVTVLNSQPNTPPNSIVLESDVDGMPIKWLGTSFGGIPFQSAGTISIQPDGSRGATTVWVPASALNQPPGSYKLTWGFSSYAGLSCISNQPCYDGIYDESNNKCGFGDCTQTLQPGGHLVYRLHYKAKATDLRGVTMIDYLYCTGSGCTGSSVLPPASPPPSPNPNSTPILNPSSEMKDLFDQTNQVRVAAGSKPLVWCGTLARSGEDYVKSMVDNNFYGHVGIDGSHASDRAIKAGYDSSFVGENLNQGPLSATVDQVMASWLGSAEHAQNMKDPRYQHGGFAHLNSDSRSFWAQEFGAGGKCQ